MPSLSRNQLASLAQQARLFRVAQPWQEPCAGEEVPWDEAEPPAREGERDEDGERKEREEAEGEVEKDLRAGGVLRGESGNPCCTTIGAGVGDKGLGWLT